MYRNFTITRVPPSQKIKYNNVYDHYDIRDRIESYLTSIYVTVVTYRFGGRRPK